MVDGNPNMEGSENMDNYKVTLRRGKKQMTLHFSMGRAICREPSADDVLDCLASDSSSVENARDFADFASEMGYDEDSRKAERIYKVCQKQAARLKSFLGDDEYKVLLWETERL